MVSVESFFYFWSILRWWITLFFHLIDIAVLNSYSLFLEHKAKNPDQIERPAGYTHCDFRDELVRQICGFEEYNDPLCYTSGRPRAPPPPPPSVFATQHIPRVSEVKRNCLVCYKWDKVGKKIAT